MFEHLKIYRERKRDTAGFTHIISFNPHDYPVVWVRLFLFPS